MLKRGQFIQAFFSVFEELSVLESCLILARVKKEKHWPQIHLTETHLKLEWEARVESYVRNPAKEETMPYTYKDGFSIEKWKTKEAQESMTDLLEGLVTYGSADPVDMDMYYGKETFVEDDFTLTEVY